LLFNHRDFFAVRFVLTLALLAGLFIGVPVTPVRAATLIVPDNYRTIQAAINAASPGDTIVVRSGTYFENLALSKSVILTAASYSSLDPTRNTTIIDGSQSNSKATITIPAGLSPMPPIGSSRSMISRQ
jgi:pectin methylesterase-like acyl-CoA thioesterase